MLTFRTSTLWDGNSSFRSVFWKVNLFSWVRRYPKFVHSRTFCWKHTCSFHSEEKPHRKERDSCVVKTAWCSFSQRFLVKKTNLLDLHKRTLLSSGKRRKKSIYLLAFFVAAYERQLALNSWHAMIYGCNYCNIILGSGFPPVIK